MRLERLSERVGAVRVDPGLVEKRVEPLGLALDKLALRLGETARLEERREKATEAAQARVAAWADKATEQLSALSEAVPAVAKVEAAVNATDLQLRGLQERIGELQGALARHAEGFRNLLQAETAARGDHRGALERINAETLRLVREHNARLEQELAVERDLVGRVENGLVRLVDDLTARVNGAAAPQRGDAA